MNNQEQLQINQDLQVCLAEMNLISQRKNPGPDQKRRFQYLSQRVAALRSGFSPLELDQQKLREVEEKIGGPRTVFASSNVPPEKRAVLNFLRTGQESRDVVKGTFSPGIFNASLGSFVDPSFWQGTLPMALKAYDAVLDPQVSTIIETKKAGPLQIPFLDDVSNPADLLGESVQETEADPTGGQLVLGGYGFKTPRIKFGMEWGEDVESGYGLLNLLEASAAMRLSLGLSHYATVGTGVSQPLGIVPAAIAAGGTVSAAGSTAIVRADLEKLYHSVNAAYRSNSVWLCNDSTMQKLRSLADTATRPLLNLDRGGNSIGEGLQIFGKPVLVSPSIDSVQASSFPLLYGNCKYFIVRRVQSAEYVKIYKESTNLIEFGMLAMSFFSRMDSGLIAPASGSPLRVLQMTS